MLDGRAAYERSKGKNAKRSGIEFGEKDSRPEKGESATDGVSGELIDASDCWTSLEEEWIELCESRSTADKCLASSAKPPLSTQ